MNSSSDAVRVEAYLQERRRMEFGGIFGSQLIIRPVLRPWLKAATEKLIINGYERTPTSGSSHRGGERKLSGLCEALHANRYSDSYSVRDKLQRRITLALIYTPDETAIFCSGLRLSSMGRCVGQLETLFE
jgi:hypothetical protein